MAKKAKQLTKKQIVDRAKRGWATRRAKVAEPKPSTQSEMQSAVLLAANRPTPNFLHDFIESFASDETIHRMQLRKNNMDEVKEQLRLIAGSAFMRGRREATKTADERHDRTVVDGFLAELAIAQQTPRMLWSVADHVVRAVSRVIQKQRHQIEKLESERNERLMQMQQADNKAA